jgi:5'-3' exoribonuclease 1
MMMAMFSYLETLVDVVRPQKVLYIAIDGVAPRAKINQHSHRRVPSATATHPPPQQA